METARTAAAERAEAERAMTEAMLRAENQVCAPCLADLGAHGLRTITFLVKRGPPHVQFFASP